MAVDVRPHGCPYCGRVNEAATSPADPAAVPRPGDVAICFTCAGVGIYTEDGTVRQPTVEEDALLRTDRDLVREVARLRVAILRPRG